ncbi:hypothetical protein P280DRAFT_472068 [Massarina eburnea CBS 473.64]|uniref:Zn(2)-C6 fungal-type domain-containing protein n=1 Tax=Massarina eburnea CBS 473.64 TaxID=1395130 RepID=A0A6A6RQ39_9PLEO|nr:hypothetical protein P280DRAFT_472068 [Massarina eburnea CBS 473.64]
MPCIALSRVMPDGEHIRSGPGRPKLRSSCNGCGTSKLRCDRGQPECGRCLSHGIQCVYGLSRKMGKPPRQRRPRDDQLATPSSSTATIITVDAPTAWDILDDPLMLQPDAFESLTSFTSLDFADWASIDQSNGTYSTESITQGSSSGHETPHPNTASTALVRESGHDCSREAYDILGSLSLFNLDNPDNPDNPSGSASNIGAATIQIPLDHVLRLSREAGERLSKLTACSCPPCTNFALLCASIISRVLNWYRQAASSASTTAASVTPASIAVGSFNVDDLRVQAALKIQLLLGEMRRAGVLIDQFSLHNSGRLQHPDEASHGGVESLYQNLDSWLRGEYARIIGMMRSKLRELNA